MVKLIAVAAVALAGALPVSAAQAARDDTLLASPDVSGGSADGDSFSAAHAISGDGRYVAFYSAADDLTAADTDTVLDVFVRDLDTGTTTLVSRASGAAGVKGDLDSTSPVMSANGRYVAFVSNATNLDPADTDSTVDVFVRDLQANTTTLVSRATTALGAKGNGNSFTAAIAGDGGSVVFYSTATNLDPDDTDSSFDVFVRNVQANTTTLVSRATTLIGAKGNGSSAVSAMTSDGRKVAFSSVATNLSTDDTDATMDVFLRDLVTGTTTLVSRDTGVAVDKGNGDSTVAAISDDGNRVAFHTASTNFDPMDLDLQKDVYIRDLAAGTTTLVSRAAGATGAKGSGGNSLAGGMSADGRYVAFSSTATGIHPDDGDHTEDVFVRDLSTNGLVLVSRSSGPSGAKGDAASTAPALSSDGRFAGFTSLASNLAAGAANGSYDAFRRDLLSPLSSPGPVGGATPGPGQAQAPMSVPKRSLRFAKARYRLMHGRRLKVSYSSSLAGPVRLELRKGRRVLAKVKATARQGKSSITWRGRIRTRGTRRTTALPLGRYTLRLVTTAGQKASATARLTVVRR